MHFVLHKRGSEYVHHGEQYNHSGVGAGDTNSGGSCSGTATSSCTNSGECKSGGIEDGISGTERTTDTDSSDSRCPPMPTASSVGGVDGNEDASSPTSAERSSDSVPAVANDAYHRSVKYLSGSNIVVARDEATLIQQIEDYFG